VNDSETYRAPILVGVGELRERGSRFLARVEPASGEQEARRLVAAATERHRDATHVCWAWRLGWPSRERWHDAGEPVGTAGMPILRVLRGRELADAVAIVTRWFGGIKLGKGGLARAYAAAAQEALEGVTTERRLPRALAHLALPYEHLGALQRLVHPPELELVEERYGERVELVLAVAEGRWPALAELAAALGLPLRRG
jgi:uncharacterized YigZ family protein